MTTKTAPGTRSDASAANLDPTHLERLSSSFELRRAMGLPRLAGCSLALLLAAPGSAGALELGEANVKSTLGEALRIEVPFSLGAGEQLTPDCISLVRSPAGAASLPAYTNTRRITTSGNRIQVVGGATVRDPLIGLNLRVTCRTTPHIVRSYMLFIDPPATTPFAATARAEIPVAVSGNDRITSTATDRRTARGAVSDRALGKQGGAIAQGTRYTVVRGDTLSGIAARVVDRPTGVWKTVEQIFESNPGAFTNGDRDLLETGSTLEIPSFAGANPVQMSASPVTAVQPNPAIESPAAIDTPLDAHASAPQLSAAPAIANESPDHGPDIAQPLSPTNAGTTTAPLDANPVGETANEALQHSPFREIDAGATTSTTSLPTTAQDPVEVRGSMPAADSNSKTDSESGGSLFSSLLTGLAMVAGAAVLALLLMLLFRRKTRTNPASELDEEHTLENTAIQGATISAAAAGEHTQTMAMTPSFDDADGWTTSVGLEDSGASGAIENDSILSSNDESVDLFALDMSLPDDNASSLDIDVGSARTTASDIIDDSAIFEMNVGAELSAEENHGSVTNVNMADLDLLTKDYEAELTATQRLDQKLVNEAMKMNGEDPVSADEDTGTMHRDEMLETQEMPESPVIDHVSLEELSAPASTDEEGLIWDENSSESALLIGEEILGNGETLEVTREMPQDYPGDTAEMPLDTASTDELERYDGSDTNLTRDLLEKAGEELELELQAKSRA